MGNYSPIYSVKDFADPKVAETLKKIQEARAKEKKSEKARDSGREAGDSGLGTRKGHWIRTTSVARSQNERPS